MTSALPSGKNINCYFAQISMFSRFRALKPKDFAALGGKAPTSGAITEGSIEVFPSKPLSKLSSVRNKYFREISQISIRTLGSANVSFVPDFKTDKAEAIIKDCEEEFESLRAALELSYDDLLENHADSYPEAKTTILERAYPKSSAIARCSFRVKPITIAVAEGDVSSMVTGLASQLFEEVAHEIRKILENDIFKAGTRVGQRSLRPIKAQLQKLRDFQFLDPSVAGSVRMIEDIFQTLPTSGYIENIGADRPLAALYALLAVMAEAEEFESSAKQVANGVSSTLVLKLATPASAPSAQQSIALPPQVLQASPAVLLVPETQVVVPALQSSSDVEMPVWEWDPVTPSEHTVF